MAEENLVDWPALAQEWLGTQGRFRVINRWIRLNNSPLAEMSVEQIKKKLPPDFPIEALSNDHRVRNCLDHYFRTTPSWQQWVPWEDGVPWCPEDLAWRLVMQTVARWIQLARITAVYCSYEAIQKAVDRESVTALRKEYGMDLMEFALLRAPYLRIPRPQSCLMDQWPGCEEGLSGIRNAGRECIERAFSNRSPSFQRRMAQKIEGCFTQGPLRQPLDHADEALQCLYQLNQQVTDLFSA